MRRRCTGKRGSHICKHRGRFVEQPEARSARKMRGHDDVRKGRKAVVRRPRLDAMHIESRARNRSGGERVEQRILVDGPAAAGVNEERCPFHRRESHAADQPIVRSNIGGMHRGEVGLRQQRIERAKVDAERLLAPRRQPRAVGIMIFMPKVRARSATRVPTSPNPTMPSVWPLSPQMFASPGQLYAMSLTGLTVLGS